MALRVAFGSAAVGTVLGWFGNNYYNFERLWPEGLWHAQSIPRKPGLPIYGTVSAATPFENKNIVSRPPDGSSVGPKRISQVRV